MGTNGLAARYSAAFAAYLADGGEEALGAAYDLGREAVAEQLSVLDLADVHHEALKAAHAGDTAVLRAAADFLRESLSTFETVHRGYLEVQEVARLEHEYIQQLGALAEASVAINSSLTVDAILRLAADAAREIVRAARATIALLPPDPRLRPLTATSPERLGGDDPNPARMTAKLIGRGREVGVLEVTDAPQREFSARDRAVLTQLAQLTSVAITNAQLYDRERTIASTLQRSLRPGELPPVPGLAAAVRFRPAGEGIELGGDFYDLFEAGGGAWTALIGDVQGKGPDAAAVTALARHTMRAAAAYESRPSGVLNLLHRALRDQAGDEGRFCTVCYVHLRVTGGRVALELACGGHPLPLVVHTDGRVTPVGRLGTLLGSDIDPRLADAGVVLAPGDVIVLYTDGVTEVRRRRQEVFGQRELVALLRASAGMRPDAIAARVEAAVLAASEERLRDDMAILAFGPLPPEEIDG